MLWFSRSVQRFLYSYVALQPGCVVLQQHTPLMCNTFAVPPVPLISTQHFNPPHFVLAPPSSPTTQKTTLSIPDILVHHKLWAQRTQQEHGHTERTTDMIQRLIEKLSTIVQCAPEVALPLQQTIIALVTRPEIDTRQVLALLALAKKARCIGIELYSSIMDHYLARKGDHAATKIYEYLKMDKPFLSPSSYNVVIRTLCNGGQVSKALDYFKHMVDKGVRPNIQTFTILLFHTQKMGDICMELFEQVETHGIRPTTTMYNFAIYSAKWTKKVSHALQLRDQMVEKGTPIDVETYNALMDVLFSVGRSKEGFALFEEMKQHVIPNATTYTTLFAGARDNSPRVAELLGDMKNTGMLPSVGMYNFAIKCFGESFDVSGMKTTFAQMLSQGLTPSIQNIYW